MSSFDGKAKSWDEVPARTERANAVADAIRGQVALSASMTALEYGCGTGLLSFALRAELGRIILADSSTGMLEVLRQKIAGAGITNLLPLQLDLAVDPLPAERFDLIFTLMTLHHIQDTEKILGCFHALLHPGGVLCIADLDKEDGSFHAQNTDFEGHNGFDRIELGRLLERTGFTHIRFNTCYTMKKEVQMYPLFLAVAEKI